jgi:hypothetical protein
MHACCRFHCLAFLLLVMTAVSHGARPDGGEGAPVKVAILGHPRSGTTMVGGLFDVNPDVFYLFEPLHDVLNCVDEVCIRDLFNCDFHLDPRYKNVFWPYARSVSRHPLQY